ncbi:uncharacterized protein RCO7_01476 [Rhynchosporium graminicola]|uniref:BTB domain-containing protein n=1 Tax=Rhynchosporium graminicola TaxID=2792576 RepID=A0A1E1K3R6_9HELO|nr:uncharacterized protein RCO7_01476 [Rhynchosporium commune]
MSHKMGTIGAARTSACTKKPKVDFSKPSALITIVAGKAPHAKGFSFHQDIICFYSPVFKNDIAQGCNSIELEDVEVSTLGLLAHWIYTQEIRLENPDTCKNSATVVNTHLLPLSMLWKLASRFNITGLQNTVINKMVSILDAINIVDATAFVVGVYEDETTINTPIRALAIHHAAKSLTPELLADIRPVAPVDFLYDMSMAFVQHNDLTHNSNRYNFIDPNRFHVGIPEVDEEMLDLELKDLDCEDPDDEKDDENVLQEHFRDDATLVADEVSGMAVPCGDDFHKEDGVDVDQEDVMVEEEDPLGGIFD